MPWEGLVLAALLGLGAVGWAHARDPFKRVWFTVRCADAKPAQAVALLPKPVKARPVVLYLHGSGGALLTDGNDLRQMAEPGLAVVALDYCQTNDAMCQRQMTALFKQLQHQTWAKPDESACLGYSLGAEKATGCSLGDSGTKPRWLVRLAGGGLPATSESAADITNIWHRLPPLWIVHGEQDEVFPVTFARHAVATLRSNGVPSEATFLPGLGHSFQPERAGVYRALGEGCLSRLRRIEARTILPSPLEWRLGAKPLWTWWLPAAAWVAGCCVWRQRGPHRQDAWATPQGSGAEALSWSGMRAWRWGLRSLAALLGLAVGARLALPLLPVSPCAVWVAERWLVPRAVRADFAWLAAQPACARWRIGPLREHAELSDYNRSLVNWRVDDAAYRDTVLSPVLEAGGPAETGGWRRGLWESLYPRIRKENSSAAAAATVQRHLRERVSVARAGSAGNVAADYRRQLTDAAGWERLTVAAWRAVGIPARLRAGRAEYWDAGAWRVNVAGVSLSPSPGL